MAANEYPCSENNLFISNINSLSNSNYRLSVKLLQTLLYGCLKDFKQAQKIEGKDSINKKNTD
jgi:hypothetical protein